LEFPPLINVFLPTRLELSERRLSNILAIAVLVAVFASNIYRAIHQSITADEAFVYNDYIGGPWDHFFLIYDAGNHVLQTLASRLSVAAFGLSEFSMRLPTLLGGLLYLIIVYRLCRYIFRTDWVFLLAVATLSLNPFVSDYLSAARGYGMALGLFFLGLYLMIRFVNERAQTIPEHMPWVGLVLGLSVTANLVFVIPSLALGGLLMIIVFLDKRLLVGLRGRLRWLLHAMWIPFFFPVFVLLEVPLSRAHKDAFYYGKDSLHYTASTLILRSFFHHYNSWAPGGIPQRVIDHTEFLATWVAPAVILVLLGALLAMVRRWVVVHTFHELTCVDRAYFFVAAATFVSFAILVAAHWLLKAPYPIDRGAIYIVPLLTLATVLLVDRMCSSSNRFITRIGIGAATLVLLSLFYFARGATTSYYSEWRYDAGTKDICAIILQRHRGAPNQNVRVGVDWKLEPSMNFYRDMYSARSWMKQVDRATPELGAFDYYVLLPEDATYRSPHLQRLYRSELSQQELAVSYPESNQLSAAVRPH
jgi:hypothetical protein